MQVFPVTTRMTRGEASLSMCSCQRCRPDALPPAWSFDIHRPIVNESISYRYPINIIFQSVRLATHDTDAGR